MSDVVRVNGSSLKIQSSLDFYLRITSLNGIKTKEELRKSLYSRFMKEEQEKSKDLYELEKSVYDSIKEGIEEVITVEPEVSTERSSETLEGSHGCNAFLQLVQAVEVKKQESKPSIFEDKSLQFVEHGRFVEDYIEREYTDHGRFVEDYYDEDPCSGEEFYEDGYEEDEYATGDVLPISDESSSANPEEFIVEEGLPFDEEDYFKYKEETVVQEEVKPEVSMVDDGKGAVDIPKDLRDFIRQHPCSDVSYVMQFYSRKEIEKQIKLGRVYKKKGKLMI